jgi:hypothetical protein
VAGYRGFGGRVVDAGIWETNWVGRRVGDRKDGKLPGCSDWGREAGLG